MQELVRIENLATQEITSLGIEYKHPHFATVIVTPT